MLLSRDEEVMELGLTPKERKGLDVAVADLRRVLGPVDAYLAKYSSRNGMNGRRTVIFGTKVSGRDGRPLLSMGRVDGRHVLRFTIGSKEDRKVLQAVTECSSWREVLDSLVYPLEALAEGSTSFQAKMASVGKNLEKHHRGVYDRRAYGKSRMPADYRAEETPGPPASVLLGEMDKIRNPTTRLTMMEARLGQGTFRREMLKLWDHRCAVTDCTVPALIRASHAQPWAHEVTEDQWLPGGQDPRLDPHNGLPLVGTLDLLFDAGLMTFDDDGDAIFADKKVRKQLADAGLIPGNMCLRKAPGDRLKHYLAIHRGRVFKGKLPRSRTR
ncbi:hypothetical protein C6Y55_00705 [Stenotrophomonas maltophilia]|nr:hypothetical protein C6Y55_00705 [Stenotrophomonas maltophilia]